VINERPEWRTIFLLFVLSVSIYCGKSSAQEKHVVPGESKQEYFDELILAAFFDSDYISNGVLVKIIENEFYFPLGDVFSLLRFQIFVSTADMRASGWYIDPANVFELNHEKFQVIVNGKESSYNEKSVVSDQYELYTTAENIEKWFPLVLKVDEESQTLLITSSVELPIQKEKKRREKQKKVSSNSISFYSRLKKKIPEYRLISWPASAIRIGSSSKNGSATSFSYDFDLFGDLLGLNGELSVQGSGEGGINRTHLSLGRRDPSRSMFGFLQVAEVEIGDVGLSAASLIGGGAAGRGLKLGNRYLTRRYDVAKADFEGILKSGYEVELYINTRLSNVFHDNGSGRYLFEDVALTHGENVVNLVFYGPNGEKEEQIERVFVGNKTSQFGELFFDFALVDQNKSVFYESISGSDDRSDAKNMTSLLNLGLGVGKGYELTASIAANGSDNPHVFSAINKRSGGSNFRLGIAIDKNRNHAYSLNMFSKYRGVNGSANFTYYSEEYVNLHDSADDARSEQWRFGSDLSKAYDINGINSRSAWRFGTGISGQDSSVESISFSSGLNLKYDLASTSVDARYTDNRLLDETSVSGSFRVRSRFQDWKKASVSLDVGYRLLPEVEIEETAIGAAFRDIGGMDFNARLTHDNADEGETLLSLGTSSDYKNIKITYGFYIDSESSYGMNIGAEYSLLKHPSYFVPRISEYYSADNPRIAVHAFEDVNSNGYYDSGEPSVSNIGLMYNGLPLGTKTDFYGNAVIADLSRDVAHDITVNPSTVVNPYLRPKAPLHAIAPRPGRLSTVQLPLVPTGDVEGFVTFSGGGREVGASNVRLLISSTKTGKQYEVYTEFDGLYAISGVPLGEYTVVIDEEYLESVGLISHPTKLRLNLQKGNSYWADTNFNLKRKE